MKLPLLKQAKVSGKTFFLRADLDVPLSQQTTNNRQQTTILDDSRLLSWMPTLEYLLENGAKVVIAGHLGRPEHVNHESRIMNHEFSLRPVAEWLYKKLEVRSQELEVTKIGEFDGWRLSDNLFLLENLRFYKGEEENDKEFAKKLASFADIYVNDAFAASHRAHASIVGVPKYLPHFAGLSLRKEIEILSKVLEEPDRPLVVIVGGAKIETKLPLVEKMHHFADYVLVGGKIAQQTRMLLKVQHEKLKGVKSALLVADLNEEETDITPKSVENFLQIVALAKTVVWNGPVGKTQNSKLRTQNSEKDSGMGTRELAKGIVKSKAYSVVGGGDTIGFLKRINLLDKFSFVSTGGGAMLEFLSASMLVGIKALE